MKYYHELITEKSWRRLQELRRIHKFILIGGWAVYLYTKALKSRDIDLICDYNELERFKSTYELVKNDRLKKYEIHAGEFDIDIYVPFFSNLGLPVEDLLSMTCQIEGFFVLEIEVLLILKQKAFSERALSAKGQKDRLDIFSMLKAYIDFKKYLSLLKKYDLAAYRKQLIKLLKETREVPELRLSAHAFSKLKKKVLTSLG